MNENFFEKIIYEHDKTEAFISLFFAGIDAIIYFSILYFFGCDYNKKCFSSRQKASILIIIDTFFRIIYLYISTLENLLLKEIILTSLATILFFITIILLNNIFTNKNIDNAKIEFPIITSLFFFFFSIKLEFPKIIILGKYISSIVAVIIYTFYIGRKVEIFLSCIEKKNSKYSGKLLHSLTYFIGFYYIIYFCLKILNFYFEDEINSIYIEFGIDIIKEIAKFMTFCLVISLYYFFQRFIKDNDYDYASYTTQTNVIIN
jgi:hypothetical protein